jgi:hypothetical protein
MARLKPCPFEVGRCGPFKAARRAALRVGELLGFGNEAVEVEGAGVHG